MSSECKQYELAISAYMDGELTKEETPPLFKHLGECDRCRIFWDSSMKVERTALREKRIVASGVLDERIALIGQSGQHYIATGEVDGPSRGRSIQRQAGHQQTVIQNRKQVSYSLTAIASLLAGALGIILGTLQPWYGSIPERTEPQVVYVSILPNITVLGHLNDLNRQGESK